MLTSSTPYLSLLTRFAASIANDTWAAPPVTAATRHRVDIYRNNARLNRIAALTGAFANTVQLVGPAYFHALARAYVDRVPAKSGNLHDDGTELPEFIRGFAPAAQLPYLGDVAALDWALHRAYFASDARAVDSAALTKLGPDRFAAASLKFVPSVGLVISEHWPIVDILRMHAGGPAADLSTGGQSVLVWREAFVARTLALAPAEATAAARLMSGSTIQETFSQTGADAQSLLSQLFGRQLILAIEEQS